LESIFDLETEDWKSSAQVPRLGVQLESQGQSCNVLQLSVSTLEHGIDWELASRSIRCLPGRIVVEMLPALTHQGVLDVPDVVGDNCRPDVGVVLSQGKPCRYGGPAPGTLVCVRPYDGSWIEGADCGAYVPSGQIRIYGAFKDLDEAVATSWWDSVICGLTLENGRVRLSRPYVDKIVLKLDPIEQAEGEILLGDLAQYRNGMATVIAAGSAVDGLAEGDRVCYDVNMLIQTGLGLDLVDDRDYSICTAVAINYVLVSA